jgi:hypothetical protein
LSVKFSRSLALHRQRALQAGSRNLDCRPEFLKPGKAGVGQNNLPRAVLRLVPSTGFFGLAPKENIFLLRICF